MPTSPLAGEEAARRASICFVGLLLTALLLVSGINYAVDPLSDWGSPLGIASVAANDRPRIAQALSGQYADAQILVLGSSHVGCLSPDYIGHRTGLRAYNAAFRGGRVESMVAVQRFAAAHARRPLRLHIIGVDVGSFVGEKDLDTGLSQHLGAYYPAAWSSGTRMWYRHRALQRLVSLQTLRASAASMRASVAGDTNLQEQTGHRVLPLAERAERTRRRAAEYWKRYEADSLEAVRIEWFAGLVRSAHEAGSDVVMFTTPLHPDVHEACVRRGNYPNLLDEALGLMDELADEMPGVVALDLSEIDRFGGTAEEFIDGVHATTANGRLIIDSCLDAWAEEGGNVPEEAAVAWSRPD